MRKIAKLAALVLAAMAAATQAVWDGSKWVMKSLFAPPQPVGVEVGDAMDAVAARAAAPVTPSQPAARDTVTPAPAPAPKSETAPKAAATAKVVELDPVLAKGKAAYAFACALATLGDEPPTEGLNEAEIAWLNSLNTMEMMHIWRGGPMQAGAHMLGIKAIPGLPLCPTLSEYRHILGSAAQVTPRQREEIAEYNATLDQAFEDMISDPGFQLKQGI
ncbi:hypothetical protein SAMN02799622_04197 [Methylobacterium sp. UNC378MF]|uniref:Uncharacterized protein n=1 Tax=Methylobacterium oryzae TaxID=334852 RepID=A0ABU7TL96_9HYPH|nr:hypothetical protein [Methylobacterium sp. UNC378MF]SDA27978.1 hypothetical protein SAMN02799622_04197 [Methylobacterium sp. UNC378MF]